MHAVMITPMVDLYSLFVGFVCYAYAAPIHARCYTLPAHTNITPFGCKHHAHIWHAPANVHVVSLGAFAFGIIVHSLLSIGSRSPRISRRPLMSI